MNIKKNTNNLFAEWEEIHKGICFYTRSPFPEKDYFCSSKPLPHCRNNSYYLSFPINDNELNYFLREQLAILKFNNPKLDRVSLESVFRSRFLNWKGNEKLKEFMNAYNHMDLLNEAIDDVLDSGDVSKFIELYYTKHWYGERVIKLPTNPKSNKWGERRREKHSLRTSHSNQQKRKTIEEVSLEYQNENFGILPAVCDIKEATGMSDYAIKTYGEGLFLNKSENTKQKVVKYLELHSDLTYKEIAEKYNIKERTVKRYSKFKKMNDDTSGKRQSGGAKN